ncbi:transcription-repair coupling factor [bacterium]|nr:transcription-repair coupling factor [bacterium]
MNSREFIEQFDADPILRELEQELVSGKTRLGVKGAVGSFKPILAYQIHKRQERSLLICCSDEDEAAYFYSDLAVFDAKQRTYLWKDSYRRSFDLEHSDTAKVQSKTSVLDKISDLNEPIVVVTYPEAMAEKIIQEDEFLKSKLVFKVGEELDLDFLIEVLYEYAFEREDFVYEGGQFSIRGGIVDLFSFAAELPYRIELNGRTIESIREFDPISQLSTRKMNHISVVPDVREQSVEQTKTDIFSYLGRKPLVVGTNLPLFLDRLADGLAKLEDQAEPFFTATEVTEQIQSQQVLELSQQTHFRTSVQFDFQQSPQPVFNKNFNLLIEEFQKLDKQGYTRLVFSESVKQVERLESIFEDLGSGLHVQPVYQNLSEGFIYHALKLACFTEHQIFNRFYLAKSAKIRKSSAAISLKELRNLKPGDFVVHIDHGIGQFEGLQKMEMGGKMQEAVRIRYKNGDLLYVNIGALYKLSKFKGQEGQDPKLNKLGSDAWQKLKSKTKSKVKDVARDLIKLYAQRKAQKGFAFTPDTYLQTELEASFLYEDTPDQAKATEEIKKDMEGENPMDRLICGDVGFGKTEVAVRAAFKAVTDSKQVAVLVPTTILAQQHYHTFKDRLEDFPCTVDYINRFRTSKQQKSTLDKLAEGKVDIIIGTHKLLNKKIKFKDLGLLIIDEEQKFGVSAKERLKELRLNVDTLTLTATPIPRTLHFSLMGARDLSIIQTPPPNRRPVETRVQVWNDEIIKDAVTAELERGGQVFVVHNRVKDIQEIALRISEQVPHARVAVGHGQMKGDELEQVMVQFIEGEFDVLVATTIIESGLDIPNANTIIINNAHMFGLSDLHQMRGRVGRSNVKACCYLLAPPLYTLPEDGRRRLQAIEEYADLGSGFNVAMRDLDIRGAGNLLGAEQSGFISEIGFQMYHKILDEAINELKDSEFKGLFDGEEHEQVAKIESVVEPDFEALIPDWYVQNIAERINLYTKLSNLDLNNLEEFKEELIDRFGPIPAEVRQLFFTVELKEFGERVFAEKIKTRGNDLILYFSNDLGDEFYQSAHFGKILQKVKDLPRHFEFKQSKRSLILVIKGYKSLYDALEAFPKPDSVSQNERV